MKETSEVGKSAIDELLQKDTPEGYYETLSVFYEAYVSGSQCDGTTGDQRALVLTRFKSLRLFLYRIKQEGKLKSHRKTSAWIH